MRLTTLCKAAAIDAVPGQDCEISRITCEISRVEPGVLYICQRLDLEEITGLVEQAAHRGAAAIIATAPIRGIPVIHTDDPRLCIARLCSAFYGRPQDRLKVIGVTGTNGKTTVTSVIAHILNALGRKCALIGTNTGNGYTTPIPEVLFERMAAAVGEGCEYLVTEVSSHALTQSRVAPVRFETGVFTNLTRDHLDYHGTMEAYAQAKEKLFFSVKTGILNVDDSYGRQMARACPDKAVFYGIRENCDFRAVNVVQHPWGVSYTLQGVEMRFNVPGLFSVYNSLAAVAACRQLGFALTDISQALAAFPGVDGRMERVETGVDFDVIIDYAHTPDGLFNVLSAIRAYSKGRLIVLFGAGGNRDRGKRAQMYAACAQYADYIVVTSDNPRLEDPFEIIKDILAGLGSYQIPFAVLENRMQATEFALKQAQPGDIVLLAGKGHERYQIIGNQTLDYDERQVVREILAHL